MTFSAFQGKSEVTVAYAVGEYNIVVL